MAHPASRSRRLPRPHPTRGRPGVGLGTALLLVLWLGWQAVGWRHAVLHALPPAGGAGLSASAAPDAGVVPSGTPRAAPAGGALHLAGLLPGAEADGHAAHGDDAGSATCRLLDHLAQADAPGPVASVPPVSGPVEGPRSAVAVVRQGRRPAGALARGPPAVA